LYTDKTPRFIIFFLSHGGIAERTSPHCLTWKLLLKKEKGKKEEKKKAAIGGGKAYRCCSFFLLKQI